MSEVFYTPEDGNKVVEFMKKNGYKKARLLGSLVLGKNSKKDIDILIPLRNLKTKQRFYQKMNSVLNITYLERKNQFEGFGMTTDELGRVDVFFTTKYFDYGVR